MTVSTANKRIKYSGNGSTVAFTYNFRILDQDELEVILVNSSGVEILQVITTNYTVAGVGDAGGGTVTMVTAPATGESLVLRRNMPFTQGTDYTSGDAFPAETHEEALDELTMADQQLLEVTDRAIKAPKQDSAIGNLPNATNRANTVLGFDVNGDPEVSSFTLAQVSAAITAATNSGITTSDSVTHPTSATTLSDFLDQKIGRKNLIINGNFDIWQRNTTQTSAGYGSDDRWFSDFGGSTTISHSRYVFTIGQTDVPNNPVYGSRTAVTSGSLASSFSIKEQRIEDVTILSGETVTLSFWAKALSGTPSVSVEFQQQFGSGGSSTVNAIGVNKFQISTSWTKYSATITLPSVSGKTVGAGSFTRLRFWFDAGSDYNAQTDSLGNQSGTFDIAQVQLEKGSVATAFEYRPIAEELALCQRYYQKSGDASSASWAYSAYAGTAGTTSVQTFFYFATEMRAFPAVQFNFTGSTNVNSAAVSRIGKQWFHINIAATAVGVIQLVEPTWTADAEL